MVNIFFIYRQAREWCHCHVFRCVQNRYIVREGWYYDARCHDICYVHRAEQKQIPDNFGLVLMDLPCLFPNTRHGDKFISAENVYRLSVWNKFCQLFRYPNDRIKNHDQALHKKRCWASKLWPIKGSYRFRKNFRQEKNHQRHNRRENTKPGTSKNDRSFGPGPDRTDRVSNCVQC